MLPDGSELSEGSTFNSPVREKTNPHVQGPPALRRLEFPPPSRALRRAKGFVVPNSKSSRESGLEERLSLNLGPELP